MIDVGKMIAKVRKDRGYSQQQLAGKLNLSKQAVSNYETGKREPDYVTLEAIADALNVPMTMLISPEEQEQALNEIYATYPVRKKLKIYVHQQSTRIPVLGTIPAGIPLEAIEDIIDWEDIPLDWTRGDKAYFALQVRGNSMHPKYEEGDIIILRRQETCESGQDCAVIVNGNDATFKRVRISADGIVLQSINPDYDSYVYTKKQVEELPVRIIGVVVELRRRI